MNEVSNQVGVDAVECWLDAVEPLNCAPIAQQDIKTEMDKFANSPYELLMKDNRIEGLSEDEQPLRIKDWTYLQKYPYTVFSFIDENKMVQKCKSVSCLEMLTIGIFWRDFLQMGSREFPGKRASNSEVRRWIKNGSIRINNTQPKKFDDIIEFPVTQLSFFSKKKGRINLI